MMTCVQSIVLERQADLNKKEKTILDKQDKEKKNYMRRNYFVQGIFSHLLVSVGNVRNQ